MKTLVGEWISNLALITILAAMIDMVLPNGNLRKYTGFLFGLVILIMFLQPLLQWIGQEPTLQYDVFQSSVKIQNQIAAWQKERIEINQQKRLEQMIQENLDKELALELKYKTGLDNLEVSIHFGQKNGKTDFSDIQRIDVTALTKSQSSLIEAVRIKVGKSSGENGKNFSEGDYLVNMDMELDLKKHISKLYNIEPGLIYINGK